MSTKKCKDKKCKGFVDLDKTIMLQTGCCSCSPAYACNTCERLYWYQNKRLRGVKKRSGEKAFLGK